MYKGFINNDLYVLNVNKKTNDLLYIVLTDFINKYRILYDLSKKETIKNDFDIKLSESDINSILSK